MKLTEHVSTTVSTSSDVSMSCNGYDWSVSFSEYEGVNRSEFTVRLGEQNYRKLARMMAERIAKHDEVEDDDNS